MTGDTHCCLWSGHTRKQSNSLALSSINKKVGARCRSPSYDRILEEYSSPFMRLAEHLTALSHLVQVMSAWLVKTRRAPSRHSRDARVYGHSTTAMHKLSTPPPVTPPHPTPPHPPHHPSLPPLPYPSHPLHPPPLTPPRYASLYASKSTFLFGKLTGAVGAEVAMEMERGHQLAKYLSCCAASQCAETHICSRR